MDEAALEIARLEYPELDPKPFLAQLDALASAIGTASRGRESLDRLRRVLFEEFGLRGNESDYYDPRNSCLNQVLEQKLGIPITLSVVVLEVGRRLGLPVYGVGLPGHFLVGYDDGSTSTFLDPFHGGEELTPEACIERAARQSGQAVGKASLRAATPAEIATRMLANLRGIYLHLQQFGKVAAVLDRFLEARPEWAEGHRERAGARIRMRRFREAKSDLERYLLLAENPADRSAVEGQIRELNRYLTLVN